MITQIDNSLVENTFCSRSNGSWGRAMIVHKRMLDQLCHYNMTPNVLTILQTDIYLFAGSVEVELFERIKKLNDNAN